MPTLPWIFVAFLLAGWGWKAGKRIERSVAHLPEWWKRSGRSTSRKWTACRMGKHRERITFESKGTEGTAAQWWTRITSCRDCGGGVRKTEVHRSEVPDRYLTPPLSLFGAPFGFSFGSLEIPDEGDEWKNSDT